jgi:ATP-dependent exoDNAse (exonuclease V) beta subunit
VPFLERVSDRCPHEIFRANAKKKTRSSQHKNIFNVDQVKVTAKSDNSAISSARFVLQAVAKNKLRHETLQEFMLINDSVTVAVEVPVLLTAKDVHHFQNKERFTLPLHLEGREVITGHIDMVQLRGGMIYIMDFKPGAKKEKPIEQLTLYALALSRLLGLRLYHFKCAWFDDQNYYEFYPLIVVHKIRD